jgi:hypothetical protein
VIAWGVSVFHRRTKDWHWDFIIGLETHVICLGVIVLY